MSSIVRVNSGNSDMKKAPSPSASSGLTREVSYSIPPDLYCCPITHDLMVDPVVDIEGNTFERSAIEEWIKKTKSSPITRNKLELQDLKPNRTLRDVIESWKKEVRERIFAAEKAEEKQNNIMAVQSLNATTAAQKYSVDAVAAQPPSSFETNADQMVLVQINPPKVFARPPADIVCVIDVSGSMGMGVTIKNEKGAEEQTALSILDVTKHAVRTVMEVLGPRDRLSLVKYSSEAHVVCPLLPMDKAGKVKAKLALENMTPTGSTNLWDGLFKGMEVIRQRKEQTRLANIMLLTDGMPNINPPRGVVPMLQRYIESNPGFKATVNTYGFGYSLDSVLLDKIAGEMNGMYAFIPDSGFVGTIFVNSLSNVLSTGGRSATLKFEANSGTYEVDGVVGMGKRYGDQYTKTSWGAQLDIGNLPSDHARSVVVRLKAKAGKQNGEFDEDALLNVTLTYSPVNTDASVVCTALSQPANSAVSEENLTKHYCRSTLFNLVRGVMENISDAEKMKQLKSFGKFLESAKDAAGSNQYLNALFEDYKGQTLMGLENKYFNKWGKHFLLSLTRAHILQQCLNFKDPGVQFYGGKLFESIRDKADDLFNKLPPPKPSRRVPRARPMANMASLNNRYAGCFDGEGKVLMANGTFKPVKELVKGDNVSSRNGVNAKIVCMIRTTMKDGHCEMVELKTGVKLTPWHPVHLNGEWKFPNNIGTLKLHEMPFIYNAVLDNGHSLNINGINCVTLGHHLKENKVVEHPYFGTDLVINDFKQMPGWDKGFVQMTQGYTIRDKTTGLVCGMKQENAIETN